MTAAKDVDHLKLPQGNRIFAQHRYISHRNYRIIRVIGIQSVCHGCKQESFTRQMKISLKKGIIAIFKEKKLLFS